MKKPKNSSSNNEGVVNDFTEEENKQDDLSDDFHFEHDVPEENPSEAFEGK